MLSNLLLYFLPGVLTGFFLTALLVARSERQELLILLHLLEQKESYGLDMIKAGCGKRGTIYVTLNRMEERGLIVSWEEAFPDPKVLAIRGGRPRRLYAIADAGKAALIVEKARLAAKEEPHG